MTYTDTSTGAVIDGLPGCNTDDPASLEAHFGNFGFAEHFRKVVLASCREAERAKALLEEPPFKLSDDRADNRARCSDRYVSFLVENLNGRVLRERNVLSSNGR